MTYILLTLLFASICYIFRLRRDIKQLWDMIIKFEIVQFLEPSPHTMLDLVMKTRKERIDEPH